MKLFMTNTIGEIMKVGLITLISQKALGNLKFLGVEELTLKEIFNLKENEMINLSMLNDKVFKARRNSNKDVYYVDLQER